MAHTWLKPWFYQVTCGPLDTLVQCTAGDKTHGISRRQISACLVYYWWRRLELPCLLSLYFELITFSTQRHVLRSPSPQPERHVVAVPCTFPPRRECARGRESPAVRCCPVRWDCAVSSTHRTIRKKGSTFRTQFYIFFSKIKFNSDILTRTKNHFLKFFEIFFWFFFKLSFFHQKPMMMQSLIDWLSGYSWHQLSATAQPWTAPVSVLGHSWPTFSLFLPVQSSLFTLLWAEFFFVSRSVQKGQGGGVNNFLVTLVQQGRVDGWGQGAVAPGLLGIWKEAGLERG